MSGSSAPERSPVTLIKIRGGEGYGSHGNNVFLQLLVLLITLKVVSGSHHSGWRPLYMLKLSKGDILEAKDGRLLIAIDNKNYVSATQHGNNHVEISISDQGASSTQVKLIAVDGPDSKGKSAKRVALAKKMSGKLYPYKLVSTCHVEDYMKYIVRGKTKKSSTCPLKRDLSNVDIKAIESPDFYLEYKDGTKVVVGKLPSP